MLKPKYSESVKSVAEGKYDLSLESFELKSVIIACLGSSDQNSGITVTVVGETRSDFCEVSTCNRLKNVIVIFLLNTCDLNKVLVITYDKWE